MTPNIQSRNFKAMLRIDNLHKDYGSIHPVLGGITFYIEKGEMVFLTGPSGAGKSTLIRMLYLEEKPSSGRIKLGPFDLNNLSKKKIPMLRRHVGIVFQDFRLIPDRTAAENVALALEVIGKPRREIRKKTQDILRLVGILRKKDLYPHQLSGGEAQRVALARAVVTEPLVILADEPTGNLDDKNSLELFELFKKINIGGSSILIATHEVAMARKYGRRILHLENGGLREEIV
ncbi:MAG: cell division ATP-binding protein FtsE [candidate division Zixibacteria bacterium]